MTQCSVRHTRLALTTQRIGDFLLRGRPRMLWSPSSFEVWGKRGVHGTFHQFQQPLLHSITADYAAHGIAGLLSMLHSLNEAIKSPLEAKQHILKHLTVNIVVLWPDLFDLW